ncbi:MAG: hypothetical protein DDG60_12845 [Anaerolineae bacterium]|nr:MAG: hypothetical protein DDG60_12845 [Anaerolineae bacterium]
MSVDFQQVYQKIREIGQTAQQRKKTLEERRKYARFLLELHADNVPGLRQQVEAALGVDPALRCAVPHNEPLDTHLPPPALPKNAILIAADGSQINPDRHAAVQFGLINVGGITMQLSSGETTQIFTHSQLLFDDELFTAAGNPLTEGMVALRRDLLERAALDKLAASFPNDQPIITFTDGPMELWGNAGGEDGQEYHQALQEYLGVLSRLQQRGVVTAGYVEKPGSDLVVRLLELAELDVTQIENLRTHHPLRGVTDRWLFGERKAPLLQPGERSAVFEIQTKNEKHYSGALSLHFFYLNVGTEGHPWPVRVEIPRWVAEDGEKLGWLHAMLIEQCRMMGARPYPYLLHRAHECAVVSLEEKHHIEQMLLAELRRAGSETDELSYKQSAKDLPGRMSFRE